MKEEMAEGWENLGEENDWACLGCELLAGSTATPGGEEKNGPNLDGSPPPGGGGSNSSLEDSELKGGGCRGVYFDHIRHLWRANWPEETIVMDRDSKRPVEVRRCTRTKGFSAKKFGFQESKRMAVAHRKTMITSGVIRKYIYQEGGAAASAAAAAPKKTVRDKKRRKIDKTTTTPAPAAARNAPPSGGGAGAGAAKPARAPPLLASSAGAEPAAPKAAEAGRAPAMDLMLCLDPAGSASTASTTNSSPMNSSVAYDFTFL